MSNLVPSERDEGGVCSDKRNIKGGKNPNGTDFQKLFKQ